MVGYEEDSTNYHVPMRIAFERGAAEGLLVYSGATKADRVDAQTVLKLEIEKRNDEYWATWVPHKHAIVKEFN